MSAPPPEDWKKLANLNAELAELLPSLPPPPAKEPSILELRGMIDAQLKAKHTSRPNVLESNLEIIGQDGHHIPARLYKPEKLPAGGSPLVLVFHGGGFCVGNHVDEEETCHDLVEHASCTCVSVDYRLAPENPFPAAVNDAWDAFQWVVQNASQLGADPSAGFLIGGTSAGSNLAAVVALMARDAKTSPALTGIFLRLPSVIHYNAVPPKYKELYTSMEQNRHAPFMSAETVEQFISTYNPDQKSWHFNALLHPDGLRGLPRVFLQVCGFDPIRDEGLIFEKVLREEANVETKLEVYSGLPHMFFSFLPQLKVSKKFIDDTVKGAKWLLA